MESVKYVGLDVHRDTISVVVLDEDGKVRTLRRRISGKRHTPCHQKDDPGSSASGGYLRA